MKKKTKLIKLRCNECGDDVYRYKHQVRVKNYCSKECRSAGRKNRIEIKCDRCGKHYEEKHSVVDKSKKHHCSYECKFATFLGITEQAIKKAYGDTNSLTATAKILGISFSGVRTLLKRYKIQIKDWKKRYNMEVLDQKDILYYLLGAFITDGFIREHKDGRVSAIGLCSNDLDWLETIRTLICPEAGITKSRHSNCYTVNFCQAEFYELFMKLGVGPNKSLTVKMPNVPKKYMPDFLRGCIDGDGSIGIGRAKRQWQKLDGTITHSVHEYGSISLVSSSKAFMQSVIDCLNEYGLATKIYRSEIPSVVRKKDGTFIWRNSKYCYRMHLNNQKARILIEWLYYEGHKLSLNRKARKAAEVIELQRSRL